MNDIHVSIGFPFILMIVFCLTSSAVMAGNKRLSYRAPYFSNSWFGSVDRRFSTTAVRQLYTPSSSKRLLMASSAQCMGAFSTAR